jgi:hypothetical protein
MFKPLLRRLRLLHKNLGVGHRRPCRGQTSGGVLRAMACIACPSATHHTALNNNVLATTCPFIKKMGVWEDATHHGQILSN